MVPSELGSDPDAIRATAGYLLTDVSPWLPPDRHSKLMGTTRSGSRRRIDSLTRVRRAGKARISRLCPVILAVCRRRPLIRGLDCCAARFSPLLAPASRAG